MSTQKIFSAKYIWSIRIDQDPDLFLMNLYFYLLLELDSNKIVFFEFFWILVLWKMLYIKLLVERNAKKSFWAMISKLIMISSLPIKWLFLWDYHFKDSNFSGFVQIRYWKELQNIFEENCWKFLWEKISPTKNLCDMKFFSIHLFLADVNIYKVSFSFSIVFFSILSNLDSNKIFQLSWIFWPYRQKLWTSSITLWKLSFGALSNIPEIRIGN